MSVRLWVWEWSRRWAAGELLRRIQESYNLEQDAAARKASLALDRYLQVEREVRERITLRSDDVVIIYRNTNF